MPLSEAFFWIFIFIADGFFGAGLPMIIETKHKKLGWVFLALGAIGFVVTGVIGAIGSGVQIRIPWSLAPWHMVALNVVVVAVIAIGISKTLATKKKTEGQPIVPAPEPEKREPGAFPPEVGLFMLDVAQDMARTRPDIVSSYRRRSSDRVFLDLPLMEITRPYREHTTVQADGLAAVYLNKWLAIEGAISDVKSVDDGARVFIGGGGLLFGQPPGLHLYFPATWKDHVMHLAKGHKIIAIGCIESIHEVGITLSRCEIVVNFPTISQLIKERRR